MSEITLIFFFEILIVDFILLLTFPFYVYVNNSAIGRTGKGINNKFSIWFQNNTGNSENILQTLLFSFLLKTLLERIHCTQNLINMR